MTHGKIKSAEFGYKLLVFFFNVITAVFFIAEPIVFLIAVFVVFIVFLIH